VPESPRPLEHLSRALEELLLAAADGLALWRANDKALLEPLRRALEREVARWELRSDDDAAAARVRDLFAAALEAFEDEPPTPPSTPEQNRERRKPRRVDPAADRVGYSRQWPS
jgi:hypothetical protein